MFNFIFQSAQAYDQVGLFIGALVCLVIGGLILGNSFYWRVHALRAQGTVIGVISNNGMYTPVYRYVLPDGQAHEAKSDTSSSMVRGKETGRVVPLMISAHNPTEARKANSYLLEFLGLVFLIPGIWLGYTALTAYPITPMTWIMTVIMVLYFAERGYRIFIPKGQRLSIEEWKKRLNIGETTSINLAEVKLIEKLVSTPDVQQAQQTQSQNFKRMAPFVGLCAVILVCVGIYQSVKISRLEAIGVRAQGEVVRLKEEASSGNHGYSYYPIVKFRTETNVAVEFKDDVGSNPPSHRPGDKVIVLYLSENPQRDAIIDRGIWWNWAIPAILFIAAAFVAWITVFMLRSGAPTRRDGAMAH